MTQMMTDNDRHIEKADYRSEWAWVRRGLESMLEKTGEAEEIFPEDFFSQLSSGSASLYVNQQRTWFAILQTRQDAMTGEPLLCILASHTTERKPGFVHREYLPQLEQLALLNGIKTLEIYSRRKGFERTGWTPVTTCYRRRANNGG